MRCTGKMNVFRPNVASTDYRIRQHVYAAVQLPYIAAIHYTDTYDAKITVIT